MFDRYDPATGTPKCSQGNRPHATAYPDGPSPEPPIALNEIGDEPVRQHYGNTRSRPTPTRVPYLTDVLTAYAEDGKVWVYFMGLCENLGMSYGTQHKKARKSGKYEFRKVTLYLDRTRSARQCLLMSGGSMLAWLLSIHENRIAASKREKLRAYRKEALDVLERHFFGDKRPVPQPETLPAVRNGFVETAPSDDPLTATLNTMSGVLNTLLRMRESQLADQRRLDGVETDVRGVRERIGDIEGAVNDATRRLATVEAKVADPVALKPAPEPWFTVGEYVRRTKREMDERDRMEAGGGLHDLMAERGIRVKRRKTGNGYSVATYPLPILKEFFND